MVSTEFNSGTTELYPLNTGKRIVLLPTVDHRPIKTISDPIQTLRLVRASALRSARIQK